MKKIIEIENGGIVEVNQNAFTGGFSFNYNGNPMTKLSKKDYVYNGGSEKDNFAITLEGNIFKGMSFTVNYKVYQVTEPVQWYIFALAILPFIITMVLGNMPSLAKSGFYYVGGLIGGAISGLFSGLAIYLSSYTSKLWVRILICLACLAVTFGICLAVGNIIVASATK